MIFGVFLKKIFIGLSIAFVSIVGTFSLYAVLTNPYNKFSFVQNPYSTEDKNGAIILNTNASLSLATIPFASFFAFCKSGFHLLTSRYFGSQPIHGKSLTEIIQKIHSQRFDPSKPYLISGDQFSMYYPRNLGIFYSAALDPRIALSQNDWENRQKIYLQSVAYSLDAFSKYHDVSTTLVPVGPSTVTPINIFAYPADTLYSILYGLKALQTSDEITHTFPFDSHKNYSLQTQLSAKTLLSTYHTSLHNLLITYNKRVYDPTTGLVRKDIHLSSARDSVIRESSFYDNVIYWKTVSLGNDLGILLTSKEDLDALKKRIIQNFWYDKGGYFLNDLSEESMQNKSYSSDWLIAVGTGFLTPTNPIDQQYLTQAISFIQTNKIDQPFPLKYQSASNPNKEFGWVKTFIPSYGDNAIWSHWGIEYIKTLLLLYQTTKNQQYLTTAKYYLHIYTKNIVLYGGYPETYDNHGHFLQNFFYRSILINGWVVNYEEAEAMLHATK